MLYVYTVCIHITYIYITHLCTQRLAIEHIYSAYLCLYALLGRLFAQVDEILATVRHDITAVETNLEESKAKITSDTDQAVNALNGRIDFTNKAASPAFFMGFPMVFHGFSWIFDGFLLVFQRFRPLPGPETSRFGPFQDLAATQESLHTTQNSLSDCFNEVAVVRSDLERNVADTEARLKNDIRQKQQEAPWPWSIAHLFWVSVI